MKSLDFYETITLFCLEKKPFDNTILTLNLAWHITQRRIAPIDKQKGRRKDRQNMHRYREAERRNAPIDRQKGRREDRQKMPRNRYAERRKATNVGRQTVKFERDKTIRTS
jgi:hypothetical protein